MKILWLSHIFPYPPKGGVLQRTYNLIKHVSKFHDIHLLSVDHNVEYPIDVKKGIFELNKFCYKVTVINVSINKKIIAFKSLFSLKPYTCQWLYFDRMKNLIINLTGLDKFDCIHFDSIDMAEYIREIKSTPKVLNHHNIESQMMFRRSLKEKNLYRKLYFFIESLKLRYYENKICSMFNYNITVSELDKRRLLKICPEINIEVIPNGVDVDYFKPSQKGFDPQTLVFAGGMNWYPNRDAVIFFCREIWPILKKNWPNVKVIIIGHDPPRSILSIAKKDSNFIVTGFVDDVRPYLEKAHVYICPIRDGGGTKLKILDAMSMAKPIVAHPVSIEGIEAEPEKHLLLARTPHEFVYQIDRLFNDIKLCNYLSKNCRELVLKKYDFSKIGQKLAYLYNKVGN